MANFWKLLVGEGKNKSQKTHAEGLNSNLKVNQSSAAQSRLPTINSRPLPKSPEEEALEFLAGLRPEEILALQYPALLKKRDDRIAEIELELPKVEEELATLYQRRAETLQLIQVANRQQPLTLNRNSQGEGGDYVE